MAQHVDPKKLPSTGAVHSGAGPIPTGLPSASPPPAPPVVTVNNGDTLTAAGKVPAKNG